MIEDITSVKRGDYYYIRYLIKNVGNADAGQSTAYLYIDGKYVASDTVQIDEGQSKWGEFGYKIKGDGKAHSIKVCADGNNRIVESNENNNCREERLTFPLSAVVVLKPDLVIQDISLDKKDGYCYIKYLIKNVGNARSSTALNYLYVDGKYVASDTSISLNPGQSTWEEFSYKLKGTHTIKVCADGNNKIAERNEKNNCREEKLTCPLTVYPVVKPDLTIEYVDVKYDKKIKAYKITYRIKNAGAGTAGQSVTYIWRNTNKVSKLILKDNVESLLPGKSITKTVTYSGYIGTYDSIKVCADGNNKIAESNEKNNCKTWYTIY